MVKLIITVGIPASGKSTLAEQLKAEHDAVILSSDSIREELFNDVNFQDDNAKVFETLHKRANQYLSEGKNVIMDSTNINRKRRTHLIKHELKADEYICYYMNTSIGECLYNDSKRERQVGYEVINKMYKNMQIPIKSEGWNEVIIHNKSLPLHHFKQHWFDEVVNSEAYHDMLFEDLGNIVDVFRCVWDLPHDSKYHSFSVSRHIYHTYKYICENYKGDKRKEMLVASLFHDIGKAHCKSFYNMKGEEVKYANYINHENVSAQIAIIELYNLGYKEEFINYVTTLVQLHMIPHNMSEKQEKKLRQLLTDEQYNDLMFLNEADLQAH